MRLPGLRRKDDSGNGSGATYNGGFSLGVPGPVAGTTAVQLDGRTGYISLPAAPFGYYPTSGSTNNYSLTFETWFNAPVGSNGGVILGQTGGGYVPAVMLGTDGKIRSSLFWFGNASDVITSPSTYNDGNWHLLDTTYANGTQSLYIDNVLIGTQSFAETSYSPSYSYTLGTGPSGGWTGGNGGQFYFHGSLAQAAVYPTALPATQIAAHWAAAGQLVQTVAQASTTTTVVSSANPSVFSQPITFTATVSTAPGLGTPTGTVTFLDGGVSIGTGTLAGGTATFTTAALSLATHTITVSYSGDNNFQGSSSAALSQTVNQGATSTTVTSSANPSVFGQSVTFTTTVAASAPAAGTPTGTVTFLDGGVSIGTGTLAGGTATFTTAALSLATHTITVSYSGDNNFQGSSSAALSQTVNQGATSTTVTSSANPSVFGQSVTFTTTVAASAPAAGTPTGTVTFLDGGVSIGTGTLAGGTATFTTAALSLATHTITVSYSGDNNFQGSSSAASQPNGQSGCDLDDGHQLGEPVGVRPIGHVHDDGGSICSSGRHADRHRDVPGRRRQHRHGHACRRHRNLYDCCAVAGHAHDHRVLFRRQQLPGQ